MLATDQANNQGDDQLQEHSNAHLIWTISKNQMQYTKAMKSAKRKQENVQDDVGKGAVL